jgi:ubiquinone/menaquinone biosynthesis C-methylase UbiE
MSAYIADQSWNLEPERLGALELSLDSATREFLSRRGLQPGWRCLEVGAGSGSIARWLADQVGVWGHVLAIDLDTTLLQGIEHDSLQVMQCDVMRDELPEASFDLVHARLVVGHLSDRDRAIQRLIATLRPGGWLVIEDADFLWTELGSQPVYPETAAASFYRVWNATVQLMKHRGYDGHWGRHIPAALRRHGLHHVGGESRALIGDRNLTAALQMTIERFQPELIEANQITHAEAVAVKNLLLSDEVTLTASPTVSAWGQRQLLPIANKGIAPSAPM